MAQDYSICLGTAGWGVWHSPDAGQRWTRHRAPFPLNSRIQALAAHPTQVWKSTVINNKIYGVGDPIPPYFWVHWHHQELLEQSSLGPPTNAADYKNIMLTLMKPQQGLYGLIAEVGKTRI